VHRDVKPENVLISEDGRVKVTDFGLARAIEGGDSSRTHGLLLGTVAYLSPEQVEHDRTDARSDVYSAGILLFELVTGQVPFSAAAPMQVAYKHVHEQVPVPSSIRPAVPAGIDAIVGRATRRWPDDRYGDAAAFLADVRAERATLPPATPWVPTPTDTIVVLPDRRADVDPLDAPAWVNAGAAPAPAAAPAAGAAAAGIAAGAAGAAIAAGVGTDAPPRPVVAPGAPATEHAGGQAGAAGSGPGDPGSITQASYRTSPEGGGTRVRRGRKGMWVGLVALLSIGGLAWLLLGPLNRVAVPDLLGKTPNEATAILATSNLRLAAEQESYSEDYAKGLIMATDPAPDGRLRTGGTVQATVSLGPERYDVPKLAGLTLDEAKVALGAANLVLGEQEKAYDDKVKKNDIISSDPKAGTSVKRDTPVAVVVSRGPKPVEMPELVGKDADEAQKQLKEAGLKVDRSEEFSEDVAKGVVISTKPKAGTTAYRGDTVTLVVSKGPPLVTVPDVVGMGEDEARAKLQEAGFKVAVDKPLPFVVFGVNSQNPRGGTQAPKGSTVTITVV
jgi:serine/threonine-protein kinase